MPETVAQALDFGLSPETVARMRDVFSRHAAVRRAWLYGSRAKGNFRPGSDIDLTLEGEKLSHAELLRVETDLDDLDLPYKIDLSLRGQIENPDLLDHIRRVGIVFYERRASSEHAT